MLNSNYSDKEGLYLCKGQKAKHYVGDHIFRCNNGIYSSYILVCDGKNIVQMIFQLMRWIVDVIQHLITQASVN